MIITIFLSFVYSILRSCLNSKHFVTVHTALKVFSKYDEIYFFNIIPDVNSVNTSAGNCA